MKVVDTQKATVAVETNTGLTVVDCFTTWCGPCKAIKPVLDKLEEQITDVSFIAVDIENSPDFASKMNVRSVPTLLYFKDGELVHTTRGLKKQDDLKRLIESFK